MLRLVNSPETSMLIGWLTSQQRLAYNHGVSTLNRTPDIPKRAKKGSKHGLNKAMTTWRQANPAVATAPYHIHQQGSEAAWSANQLLQHGRDQRLGRIDRAVAKGKEPHPRDSKPHRRTLKYRSRKHSTQTLTIRSSKFIKPLDRYSFQIEGIDTVFRTKDPLPNNVRTMHFVEIEKRRRAANAPLHCRRYYLNVAVAHDDPELADLAQASLAAYEGGDDGIKNNLTFSDGDVFHFKEPLPNRDVRKERQTAKRKKKGSKRSRRYAASCQSRTNRRKAERKRQANLHVAKHLDENQPAAVCMENKSLTAMMSSARGPGRAQKAGLNRSLANAGLGGIARIVANQCAKRGIHVILVPPQGSSQTCPRCGNRQRKNRKIQTSFRCLICKWNGNADLSGATILRKPRLRTHHRAYPRIHSTHRSRTNGVAGTAVPGRTATAHAAAHPKHAQAKAQRDEAGPLQAGPARVRGARPEGQSPNPAGHHDPGHGNGHGPWSRPRCTKCRPSMLMNIPEGLLTKPGHDTFQTHDPAATLKTGIELGEFAHGPTAMLMSGDAVHEYRLIALTDDWTLARVHATEVKRGSLDITVQDGTAAALAIRLHRYTG